jgi:hypothetical protein
VTLPSSQLARPGATSLAAPLSQAQAAPPPPAAASSDLYAFMAKVPSPVTIPFASQGHPSGTATISHAPAPPISAASATSHPTQPATLPVPTAAGDAAFDFLAKVPSPITLLPSQGSQGTDGVRICVFISHLAL